MEQLRKRAKELRDLVRTGYPKFTTLVRETHPRLADGLIDWTQFSLADAQLVIARTKGFASWRRLREHVEMLRRYSRSPQRQGTGDTFLRLACLTYRPAWRVGPGEVADDEGRHARARELLAGLAMDSIYVAAAAADLASVRSFLDADPSLANRDGGPHGWPPLLYLMFSRAGGDAAPEVAALLLANGADPNAGYLPDGEPPPVTALSGAFHGHIDPVNQPAHRHGLALARLLLDAGADPNDEQALANASGYAYDDAHLPLLLRYGLGHVGDGGPWRPRLGDRLREPAEQLRDELHNAARLNLVGRVRLLLEHRADLDVNAVAPGPEPRRTPHDMAVLNGNVEIAELLVAAGAQPGALDPGDQLIAACMRGDVSTVDRLRDAAGKRTADTVIEAVMLDRPDAIRLLVGLGFPVNDDRGSPLHVAALLGNLSFVRLLVELGADPSAETVDDTPGQFAPPDRTPLGWAAYNHQDEVVAYLTGTP
jgi:ankyrin repeat protein